MKRILRSKYFILPVLILSVFLRLISLNQSLWLDEATTALVAKMPLNDIFGKFVGGDFHPPLYYLLMKTWVNVFGSSEISLRIPSVIFGVGTVFFIYLIAKKISGNKAAILSSLLASTSGLLIYYSQEARMYMMVAFLVTAVFYFFIEKKWIIFSVVLVLVGMSDYVALFTIPVFLLFGGKDVKKIATSMIPLFFVFSLWFPELIKQVLGASVVEKTAWWNILGVLSWKNIGLIPVKFILGRISFDNKFLYGSISVFFVFLYIYFILRRPLKGNPYKVILGWLILPLLIGIIVSIKIPVLSYFRFIFCLPALYILVSDGVVNFNNTKFAILASVLFLANTFFSGKYLLEEKFHRENWRGIAEIVGNDKIIYPATSQEEALIYYKKGSQIVYYSDFTGGGAEVWLSRYVWNIFDRDDEARLKLENLGYNKVQEVNMNGVEFWKYEKK